MRTRFGPGGNSRRFLRETDGKTLSEPAWLAGQGLDAFEYECGRGVNIKSETARLLGDLAVQNDIALSLHSPYYINLATPEEGKQDGAVRYILQSCASARDMGADRVVVHSGSVGKLERSEALQNAKTLLRRVLEQMDAAGFGNISLCIETLGKINQLGTLSEVTELCAADERLIACIDFGHLYARQHGRIDYTAILDEMESSLGMDRARRVHVHFSKIAFSKGGEVRHLNFSDEGGPDFGELAEQLARRRYTPRVICESAGDQADDALRMKRDFEQAVSGDVSRQHGSKTLSGL